MQALGLSLLFVTLATAILWFVTLFIPGRRQAAIASWRRDLDLRAEIRKEALQRYFVDGLADAETLAAFPTALRSLAMKATGAGRPVADSGLPAVHLEELFGDFVRIHRVLGVVLWDADGQPCVKSRDFVLEPACKASAGEVLASGTPATGFHIHAGIGPILTFSAPVRFANGDVRGAAVVAVDPNEWLYPLLEQPLAGTATGEAFLVGRDGADILFLSPLHNRPGAPLGFRRPFAASGLPARAALEGSEFVGPLVDYRGVRVLWGGRRIPPSPWALVVKIDEKEALAELQAGVRRTALAWGSLAVAFLGTTWGVWQMRGRRQAAALARSEARLRGLTEELESRVETRTAELKAANRELEAFSYSVSHDLRAPLRAVDGFSRILLEDHAKQLDTDGRRLLGVVRSSTRQMGQLIDDLLSFSRIGRQEMTRTGVDMMALAHAAFRDLLAADERVSFTVGPLPHADVDPSLMRQVWTNLISNALKFTRPKVERVIEVAGRTEPGRVVYSVKDNGVGFDMAYSNKLFGVFQRLHSSHEFEGTGVGLALVQRIVHRHGGEVWAEGKAGEGATFSFSLPRPGGSS